MMDKDEPFIFNEVDYKSPQSNQTWPMDNKLMQKNRFQLKMLSPVTPKRNCSVRNSKSLLLQCLRESKSDPIPRRRVRGSEGVLMDGVLVTSATWKKVLESPLGRSSRSLAVRNQQRNTEFSSPRSDNKENIRPQHSSGGKGKTQANSPSTKLETPKAAKPSKLQASAAPFVLTPKSSQRLASPVPLQQLPLNHDPHFQTSDPPLLALPSYGYPYLLPRYAYPRSLHGPPVPYLQFLRPIDYHLPHDLSQSPTSSQTNRNTSEPPVQTSTSTNTTANLSTSTTTHGSRLDSPLSVDGNHTMTYKPDLSSPSDELETMAQKPDLSPFDGLGTMKKEWSPSDDGLSTFTQAQDEFMESNNRVLPGDVFEHYNYTKRLPVFTSFA